MHELFEIVLTHRDLSRAGQLFALSDDVICHDLSQILLQVEKIVSEEGYCDSTSDQSLVEISLSRVTSCIRTKNNIEEHMAALLSLLASCLAHELSPSDAQRDENVINEYSPHGKIASDLLSCIFLNYDRKWVMQLALPVAAKYLLKGNTQLIRNVTSFLCLTSSDHRELLSHQANILLESVIKHENEDLFRVLPSLFPYNRDVFIRNAESLAECLRRCKELENRNHCLQLLSLIGTENPATLRLNVGIILESIDASNSIFVAPLLLCMSRNDASIFAEHMGVLRIHLQLLWPGMLPALLSILSGLCRVKPRLCHDCCGLLVFCLEHLPRIEQTLEVLRTLELISTHAGAEMKQFVGRIERASKSLGPAGAALVGGLKLHVRRSMEIVDTPATASPSGTPRLHVAIQTEDLPLQPQTPSSNAPSATETSQQQIANVIRPNEVTLAEGAMPADLMPTLQSASSVRLPASSTIPRDPRPASASTMILPSPPASSTSRQSSQAPSPAPSSLASSAHAPRLRYKTRSSNTLLSTCSTATGTTVTSVRTPQQGSATSNMTPNLATTPLMTSPQSGPPSSTTAASLVTSRSRFSSQMTSRSRLASVTELVDGEPVRHKKLEDEIDMTKSSSQIAVSASEPKSQSRTLRASILPESGPTVPAASSQSSTNPTTPLLTRQPSQRDAIAAFTDKHAEKMAVFVDGILPRLPLPARCGTTGRRHLLLHFACARNTIHCVCAGSNSVSVRTRQPRPWLHIMFLAHQAGRSRSGSGKAFGLEDPTVSELRSTWESLRVSATCRFVAMVTSSFPTEKQVEALRRELQDAHFFDTFEFHTAHGQWACSLCRYPVASSSYGKAESDINQRDTGGFEPSEVTPVPSSGDGGRNGAGNPPVTVQLKQKRGRLKFLRRWKTRYFTLSGAHIIYSKQREVSWNEERSGTASAGGQLPVSSIQSVKAIRRRRRDLPRAYEIFTDDNRKLLLKAVGDEDVGGWVRQLQIALARSQNSFMDYGMPPPAMDLAAAQTNGPSSEVSPLFGRSGGSGRDSTRRQKQSCL